MNLLIPLASVDQFFPSADYHFPKPLIEIAGAPMIDRVVTALRAHFPDARCTFIVREEDCRAFGLDDVLHQLAGNGTVVLRLAQPTAGAVCSCLLATDHIDDDDELVIVNGDQIIEADLAAMVGRFRRDGCDAAVITFPSVHPRWSYARIGVDGRLEEAAEKRVISRAAIAGFYYFSRGSLFIEAAMNSVRQGVQTNGAYYIAPTLNQLILAGLRVGHQEIPAEAYQSFYSPQRVAQYERTLQSRNVTASIRAEAGGSTLNILIPMAGRGSRFSEAGYRKPKPFIDVAGLPMIKRVMDNLAIPGARFILVGRREHFEAEPECVHALSAYGNVTLVPVDLETEGTACTVLLARSLIDNDQPLLIANCDQLVDFDCRTFVADSDSRGLDGSILVFRDPARDPKWSFVRLDGRGLVREAREKVAISDLATVGIYYFRRGHSFVAAAIDMIARNERTKGEFYTCPVYNHAIANGDRIGTFEIPADAMHGLGTPEDLKRYLSLDRPE